MKLFTSAIFTALNGALAFTSVANAQGPLHVYGPGGPAPATKSAAATFEKQSGTKADVAAGSTPQLIEKAKGDADIKFSGSETMMSA